MIFSSQLFRSFEIIVFFFAVAICYLVHSVEAKHGLPNTPIPLDGVSATIRNFGQNDTKRGRNAKSAAETPIAQLKRIGNFMIATSLRKF